MRALPYRIGSGEKNASHTVNHAPPSYNSHFRNIEGRLRNVIGVGGARRTVVMEQGGACSLIYGMMARGMILMHTPSTINVLLLIV